MKGNEKCLCFSSEAQCQTHISGPSAINTHGRLSESGESKWTVGPERDGEIRVICNERLLICCKRNARSHIKEDFRKIRSTGAEGF